MGRGDELVVPCMRGCAALQDEPRLMLSIFLAGGCAVVGNEPGAQVVRSPCGWAGLRDDNCRRAAPSPCLRGCAVLGEFGISPCHVVPQLAGMRRTSARSTGRPPILPSGMGRRLCGWRPRRRSHPRRGMCRQLGGQAVHARSVPAGWAVLNTGGADAICGVPLRAGMGRRRTRKPRSGERRPRTRDGPPLRTRNRSRPRASPCLRGWAVARRADCAPGCVFLHAGWAARHDATGHALQVFPAAGCAADDRADRRGGPESPGTRGCAADPARRDPAVRVVPAWGDGPLALVAPCATCESSPCTRGWTEQRSGRPAPRPVVPPSAGMCRSQWAGRGSRVGRPPARGDAP
jgi:hypothetical protein